jgi:sugar phosphate isomerase/epimerase
VIKIAGHSFQFPLLPLEGACQVMAALKLSAIDIGALKGYAHVDPDEIEANPRATADRIRRATEQSQLAVSDFFPSFGAGFGDRPINHPDRSVQAANQQRFKAFAEVARQIGSPGITLLPGIVHPGIGHEASMELAAAALGECVALARDAGLRLSFEPHLGSVTDTPERSLELLGSVPGLAVTLDYSHFVARHIPEARVHPLIESAGHVHVRQARPGRVQMGAAGGTLDIGDIVRRLRSANYGGYIAIEYTWQDWEGCKNVDTLAETVLLRDLLQMSLN